MGIPKKPEFRLKFENWFKDESREEPEIYEVTEIDGELRLTRREFFTMTSLLSLLLSGCAPYILQATGKGSCKSIRAHKNSVRSISFSPDGKLLASGSDDETIKLWDVASGKVLSEFFDPAVTPEDCQAGRFEFVNEYGQVVTYTLPCGSPIPPGATCICNCIPGSYKPAPTPKPVPGYRYCTCVPVCVCIPVV